MSKTGRGAPAGASARRGHDCGVCDPGHYCGRRRTRRHGQPGQGDSHSGGAGGGGAVYTAAVVSHWQQDEICPRFRLAGHHGRQLCLCAQYAGHCRELRRGGHIRRADRGRSGGGYHGHSGKEDPVVISAADYRNRGVYHRPVLVSNGHQLHGGRHGQRHLRRMAELAGGVFYTGRGDGAEPLRKGHLEAGLHPHRHGRGLSAGHSLRHGGLEQCGTGRDVSGSYGAPLWGGV